MMAYIFFDDSKHHDWGFSLGAFSICEHDPTEELRRVVEKNGYDPEHFEFKSSSLMKDAPLLQAMRKEFRLFVQMNCRVAVCVADGDKIVGPAGLKLLKQMLQHETLKGQSHQIFFDEGLFSSDKFAEKCLAAIGGVEGCDLHFEQDSRSIIGIQVADLVAHTCGTMLLSALGKKMKTVKFENSGYEDDVEIDLGFELWAGVRGAFLSTPKTISKDDIDIAVVDVLPHGLFVDDSVSNKVATAAKKRFGKMYLGCAH